MNKNFKIFKIHGLSGLFFLGVLLVGGFCGFVLFPIWVIMIGWNELVGNIFRGPLIDYCQAFLLWSFFAICSYLALRNCISIKVQQADMLDEESIDLDEIVEKSFPDENLEKKENNN